MSQTVTINRIPTDRDDYAVKIDLWYNDGSMRRSSRGYWSTIAVVKSDCGMEVRQLMGPGTKAVMLEAVDRFNAKRFYALADALKAGNVDNDAYRSAVEAMIAIAPSIQL